MLLTRSMAEALLQAIMTPRHGVYRIRNKRIELRDKKDGIYRPFIFKDRVLSTVEEQ